MRCTKMHLLTCVKESKVVTDLTQNSFSVLFSAPLQSSPQGKAIQWLRLRFSWLFVFPGGTALNRVSSFLLRLSGSLKIPHHEIMIFVSGNTDTPTFPREE